MGLDLASEGLEVGLNTHLFVLEMFFIVFRGWIDIVTDTKHWI